jgi:hypothetical protein
LLKADLLEYNNDEEIGDLRIIAKVSQTSHKYPVAGSRFLSEKKSKLSIDLASILTLTVDDVTFHECVFGVSHADGHVSFVRSCQWIIDRIKMVSGMIPSD